MRYILILTCVMLILGCSASECTQDQAKSATDGVYVGYPVDAGDWNDRYIFTFNNGLESGIVQCKHNDIWVECGNLSNIEACESTFRCTGPIGGPESSVSMGYIFEIIDVSGDVIRMRMTCDAFDSRSVVLAFKKGGA